MILASNIVNSKNTKLIAEETLQTLKDSLELSLGPYGSTTILEDISTGHIMTKDGFSILDRIRLNEPVSMTFLNIIKEISLKLVQTVGDGSTSSIIAAYYFYHSLNSFINDRKMRPQQIIKTLDDCVYMIQNELMSYTRQISEDLREIKDIASVSLNNDEDTGDIISDIYKSVGVEGFINIQLGSEYKTTYKQVKGFQFRAGYLDPILINNETEECVLDNAAVLVFNSPINNDEAFKVLELAMGEFIQKFTNTSSRYDSLLIIAPDYNDSCRALFREIANMFKHAGKSNKLNILRYNMNTEDRVAEIEDLVATTGARKVMLTSGEEMVILDKESDLSITDFFGYSTKVISNFKTSTFMGNGDELAKDALQARKDSVRHQIKLAKEEGTLTLDRAYFLNKRLAVLEQKLVTIYVGGNSEQQRKSNKTLMEDAVAACKSAINNGYVIGGNLSIPIVINKIFENNTELSDIEQGFLVMIKDSFISVYRNVLSNGMCDTEILEKGFFAMIKDSLISLYRKCRNEHHIPDDRKNVPVGTIDGIINKSLEEETIYDLVNEEFTDTRIINSVETEIEILKNVTSIISLILTSNQFIMSNIGMYSSKEIDIIK